jgi:hypothetical protein
MGLLFLENHGSARGAAAQFYMFHPKRTNVSLKDKWRTLELVGEV